MKKDQGSSDFVLPRHNTEKNGRKLNLLVTEKPINKP
jgi:hypothetical protein